MENQPENGEFKSRGIEHEQPHEQHETAENSHESHESKQSVEEISEKVESHARSSSEMSPAPSVKEKELHPVLVNKQLKDMAYSRAIVRVQKRLSAPSKVFSKVVHSAVLDKPSEAVSKTIARPSGMLGGALFAMVGTLLLFWTVNKYGYEYNYLAIAVLFVAGALFGLLAEGVIKFLRR